LKKGNDERNIVDIVAVAVGQGFSLDPEPYLQPHQLARTQGCGPRQESTRRQHL
jgi:hypothetical protein